MLTGTQALLLVLIMLVFIMTITRSRSRTRLEYPTRPSPGWWPESRARREREGY